MKKIRTILIALIALVAGALIYLHSNLDHMIKEAIEEYGSKAAQTKVELDSVKLSIASGEGMLSGLTVGNPQGFSSSKALNLKTISVKLDPHSVTGNGPIIISEIIIDKPEVNFEASETGNSNLQAIEKNLSANSSSTPQNVPAGNPVQKAEGKKEPERKVIISNLYIRNGQIDISHPLLKQLLTAPLPPIHLTNIGKDSGGATASQVADQVLGSIASSATSVANNDLTKTLGGALKGTVGSSVNELGNRLNGILGR
jgi:hypothetical protein